MAILRVAIVVTTLIPSLCLAGTGPLSNCVGKPGVTFICGPRNSEDLIAVPGSPWIIASGLADGNGEGGALYLIDRRTNSWKTLYPNDTPPNAGSIGSPAFRDSQCAAAVDPLHFSAHGIHLRPRVGHRYTLYVVNHGDRESIDVFGLDVSDEPNVHWEGCLLIPGKSVGNSVAPLPDGGIVVTVSNLADDTQLVKELEAQKPTGYVLEWHAETGWQRVPGSEGSFPNGIEVSPDGHWIYVTNTGTQDIVRLSLDGATVQRTSIKTGILTDNIRWDDTGQLWMAGQLSGCGSEAICSAPFSILKLDPNTLHFEQVPHPLTAPVFGAGTVALPVEDEVWVGTYRGDRIARFPVQSVR